MNDPGDRVDRRVVGVGHAPVARADPSASDTACLHLLERLWVGVRHENLWGVVRHGDMDVNEAEVRRISISAENALERPEMTRLLGVNIP